MNLCSYASKYKTTEYQAIPPKFALAKTRTVFSEGKEMTKPGRGWTEHALIVSSLMAALAKFLPERIKKRLPERFERIGLVHDLGKITPFFQAMLYRSLTDGIPIPDELKGVEERKTRHASDSYAMMKVIDELVALIIAWHHGYGPDKKTGSDHDFFGGKPWADLREELLRVVNPNNLWPEIDPKDTAIVDVLKGLLTVADWLGSCPIFDDPSKDWHLLIDKAVKWAGFRKAKANPDMAFEELFGFQPNEMQKAFAGTVKGPGVYILESSMGTGKTEAALYAAYRTLLEGNATGIYFALPTQLTSEKAYGRFASFLGKAVEGRVDPMLLHGDAWLDDVGRGDSEWMRYAKRGLLANFSTGTVDQSLMSVVATKHSFIRTLGLAGKVVVIDEAHSYDAFTGTHVEALVRKLESLGCTVIILSATLTKARKEALLGLEGLSSEAYPLITAKTKEVVSEVPCEGGGSRAVKLTSDVQREEALKEAARRAGLGQQVLWLENTVDEAIGMFEKLKGMANGEFEVGLMHSRFTKEDRSKVEGKWTERFAAGRKESHGAVLVSTQVAEQSLDIDADFLVTNICPMDMLFQRLGRLWRLESTARGEEAKCEAWVLLPEGNVSDPMKAFGNSKYVYPAYILKRTHERLQGLASVTLPDDMRRELEETYRPRVESEGGPLATAKEDMIQKEGEMRTEALYEECVFMSKNATTRHEDRPATEIVLLRNYDGSGKIVETLHGRRVSLGKERLSREDFKALRLSTVRVASVRFRKAAAASRKLTLPSGTGCLVVFDGNVFGMDGSDLALEYGEAVGLR